MGAGNWVPELVDRAGGTDLLGKAGEHSDGLTIEQLAAADPDVIAIMPCGFDIERSCREMTPVVTHPLDAAFRGREPPRVHDGRESLLRKACSAEFLPEAAGRARVSGRDAAFAG